MMVIVTLMIVIANFVLTNMERTRVVFAEHYHYVTPTVYGFVHLRNFDMVTTKVTRHFPYLYSYSDRQQALVD